MDTPTPKGSTKNDTKSPIKGKADPKSEKSTDEVNMKDTVKMLIDSHKETLKIAKED